MQFVKFFLATLSVAAWSAHAVTVYEPTMCDDPACKCDAFSRIICNCRNQYDEVLVRPMGSYSVMAHTTSIVINDCARVFFLPYSINGTFMMKNIEINNVRHLDLKENALHWSPYTRELELNNPGLRIVINNSSIDNIMSYAFKGRVDTISITNSRIYAIHPYAFSSMAGVSSIELSNNHYSNVDLHAFKKFTMINFEINGGKIHHIPSRFLSDVEVLKHFRIDGLRVGSIHSNAFMVYGPKRVTIINNEIEVMHGESFKIASRGMVDFRNNTIATLEDGAFLGFTVEPPVLKIFGPQELVIDNNTVANSTVKSFDYNSTNYKFHLDGLNVDQPCQCDMAYKWITLIGYTGASISCNNTFEGHYMYVPTYVDTKCKNFSSFIWTVLIGVAVVATCIGVTVVCFVVWREKQRKKMMKVVMPDGRTYRETELHVIVESADLLTTDL